MLNRIFQPLAELRASKFGAGHPSNVNQSLGNPLAGIIGLGRSMTGSGVHVDGETAMMYAPALAATRLLSTSIACLRIDLLKDGNKSNPDHKHQVFRLVNRKPNGAMTAFMFRASRAAFQINQGNAYAEIERDGMGNPLALHPIHSSRVQCEVDRDGEPTYIIHSNNRAPMGLPASDMFHVTSDVSDDGICGKGMIDLMAETIGAGIATERFGASFFGNGAVPEGILMHPSTLEPEARKNLRKEWKERHVGKRELAILYEGMTYEQTTIAPEQAQFLQTRKYDAELMAMSYRVPQHMIGILEKSTNNNIEHQSKEFVRYSLYPWLKIWEQEIDRKLLSEREREQGLMARFATEEFELIELESRTRSFNERWMNGGITLDERRQQEGMNPYDIPGVSDVPWMPLNLVPAPMALAQAEALVAQNQQSQPEEEDVEDVEEEPEDIEEMEPEEPEEDSRSMFRDAARDTVINDLRRMMSVETTAAKRAAKKPSEFIAWLDEFYGSAHRLKVLGAIAHSTRAWQLAGGESEASVIAAAWCKRSRQELLDASDGDPKHFEQRVCDLVDSWKTRPMEAIDGKSDIERAA